MIYKRILIATLAALLPALAICNSSFSFDGYPLQTYSYDAYASGLGLAGYGDLFRINTSSGNPSLTTTSNNVAFASAVSFGYAWYSDADGRSYRDDALVFPYFSAIVPIRRSRFAINLSSIASGNYEAVHSENSGDIGYTETSKVQANIYAAELAYAYKHPFVNVGLAASYYVGGRIRYSKLDFDDSSYMDSRYEATYKYENLGFTVGLSRKFEQFSLGAAYRAKTELKGDADLQTIFSEEDIGDADFTIPAMISGGGAWKMNDRFRACVDVNYELWADTDDYEDPSNTYKVSAGIAYDPLWGYGEWYERIPVRVGGYYRTLPFQKNGASIDEKSASFGFSVPLLTPDKKLQFGVQFTMRGDKEKNLVQDKTVMFTFGALGFDIFKKRKKLIEHRDIPKADEGL